LVLSTRSGLARRSGVVLLLLLEFQPPITASLANIGLEDIVEEDEE
jgi:hypothetical protein